METQYEFGGWATRYNVKCSDGRTIVSDAFKHLDGKKVPLVWNHDHDNPSNVIGHALLEHRDEGVYIYGAFNETQRGQDARIDVLHGDITGLSIYANHLKQRGPVADRYVEHGNIREVSLVYSTANPEAFIDTVLAHGEGSDDEEVIMYFGEEISLCHAETKEEKKEDEPVAEETKKVETAEKAENAEKAESPEKEESILDVFEDAISKLDKKHQDAVYAVIAIAKDEGSKNDDENDEKSEEKETEAKHSDEGDDVMKHNVFDQETKAENVLTHADQSAILAMAKQSNVGSLKMAMNIFAEENEALAHGFETDALTALLPDAKNLTPGAPEILRDDQSWVMHVINKIHKSPYSRIRTRQADARIADLKAKGYQKKGDQKTLTENIKLIGRTFDPQTVYIKDEIHRDDIIDITDFDYVNYVWNLMKDNMYETLALSALVGDGRDDADPDKIHENHVRSIYNDDELYTIHRTVDFEAAKTEIQGTNTGANFSENYIYAEAIIMEALYAREKFKGSGKPDLYCTPHLVNIMLLARDLNGRRIYDSKADLAKALNVGNIYEVEQLEGKTRVDGEGNTKKLLALFVNLSDYQFGSTKGGEITKFEDFDIDFNKHKYLMETRLSGALTKLYSAIALEEDVAGEEAAG